MPLLVIKYIERSMVEQFDGSLKDPATRKINTIWSEETKRAEGAEAEALIAARDRRFAAQEAARG